MSDKILSPTKYSAFFRDEHNIDESQYQGVEEELLNSET